MATQPQIEIEKEFSEKLVIHKNLGQEVVVTTVDKVRLCLMKNRELMSAKKEWLTPFGIFLALLTTLVAADFREFIFKSEVWYAMYIICTVISLCWLVYASCKALSNRSKGSIDSIIEELKAQTAQHSEQEPQIMVDPVLKSNELIIKSAKYGADDKFYDVTGILRTKIINEKIDILVNNGLFGDPIYGIRKKLIVLYTYHGMGSSKTISEGERLSIP